MNYEITQELLAATIGFLKDGRYKDVVVLIRNLEQCQPVKKKEPEKGSNDG